ncbi:MAG: prepilin-type N-terminal cleavage/methylation domain-containing protein [Geothrix sp.]|nr:prepilin-type N-terminal cleavage/methylation domain-containing protein [Geothrix sp.]
MDTRSSHRGFTLIEAAVAIAVVAILSGIIIPLVVKNLRDSQISRAKNDVQVIAATLASQIKDTGRRPQAAGWNGSTGAGTVSWGSGPATGVVPAGLPAPPAANTFTNLFTADARVAAQLTAANALFGFAGVTPQQEFQYQGPYIGTDVAGKLDPWGNRYIVLGYSQTSGAINGPVWVVSAGPNGQINAANALFNAATGYPATWNYGVVNSVSSDDLVVRVN